MDTLFIKLLKKAPKWMRYVLWGIVAVRLICPFSMESAISLVPSKETIPESILAEPVFEVNTGVRQIDRPPDEEQILDFH